MMSVSAMLALSMSVSMATMEPGSGVSERIDMSGGTEVSSEVADGEWLHSFDEAKKLSIEKNLPIVLHFEAAWCGPCRQMEASVLNQPEVIKHLGTTMIGLRIDADEDSALIAQYGISSLPTEVVIGPDGKEIARYAGRATLPEYTARLDRTGSASDGNGEGHQSPQLDENLRECLLVKHDGKVVGLGGYCPVAMLRDKQWLKGSEEFVGSFDGVDYFFQSAEEREIFFASPQAFIPGLHGCDPVELQRNRMAHSGAIELGAFYKGRLFFFLSKSNRRLFQNNPAWYADGMISSGIQNPNQFSFLKSMTIN